MARPVGSTNEKLFRTAVLRAVKQRRNGKTGDRYLDILAQRLVKEGADGNVLAINSVADRMDGKPAQAVQVDQSITITRIDRIIVEPEQISGPVIDITPEEDESN